MKRKLTILVAILATTLGACGTPVHPDEAKKDASQQESSEQKTDVETTKAALPNPHEITGLRVVSDIPDPEAVSGNFPQKLPVTMTDVEGNSVTITDTSRILALDLPGTLSRTVIALGYGKNLVGRTVSSTEEQLRDLPVVTENGHTLNTEAILSLNPTVIIADRSVGPPESLDQLRASGIPVVLIDPQRGLEHNAPLIMSVAQALGNEEAGKALVERTEKETQEAVAQIKEWIPEQPMEAAFLYVRGTGGVFFILGANEGASELISSVGGKDLAKEQGITGLTPANAESLVALNPEVIFTMSAGLESTNGMEGFLARPGVSETRAGQNQRVVAIPDGLSLSFGPQTGQTLLAVARALYGVE
ncbi:heme/hemin ABC transporter substrate-binding protein [Arcanobacterium pinnipediorum]|uniref:ABC transporter substrate-binding protein n=1 Tax=Arcanobacterium pinnipediorum TaxID=1503041 RepID=A0ABY5AIK9_9ACTO|nr:ABC transporter substrate-binding protein [Arcanobacterium pinnipediorum]USR79695.1 ABC transporter substrate-binding protein [Arcanobacterium pinnipediorum]